jgi:hypothetical protein
MITKAYLHPEQYQAAPHPSGINTATIILRGLSEPKTFHISQTLSQRNTSPLSPRARSPPAYRPVFISQTSLHPLWSRFALFTSSIHFREDISDQTFILALCCSRLSNTYARFKRDSTENIRNHDALAYASSLYADLCTAFLCTECVADANGGLGLVSRPGLE